MTRIRPNVLASMFFLFYFGAVGAMQPFLNLYYENRGMSHKSIGYLAAIPTIIGIIAAPMWSGVADRFGLHKGILVGAVCGTLLPIGLLMGASVFWTLAFCIAIYAISLSPIIAIADSSILGMLPDRDTYGRLRLWGSVGWGLSAWGSGILIESYTQNAAFIIFLSLMFLNIWVTSQLPVTSPEPSNFSYLHDLKDLLKNPAWVGFLLAIFLAGTALSIINNYLVIYLKDMGGGESLYGLAVAVGAFSELPVFFLSPVLLRKLQPKGLLLVAFTALMVRCFLYSFINNPELALLGQLLHGFSFAGMWVSAVIYVGKLAPAHLGASAQSILGIVSFGVAGVVGALLGARLYDGISPQGMFQVAGFIALVSILFFWRTEQATVTENV